MIILDATTEKLQLVLAGAITTNQLQYTTSFVDVTTTTYTPSNSEGLSNNTTDVDIIGAPDVSTQRQVKQITVYNNDTVSATVTIKKDVSGTDTILCKVSLSAGDTLQYNDSTGFSTLLSSGAICTSNAEGIALSAGSLASQTASTGAITFGSTGAVMFGLSQSSQITGNLSRMTASYWVNNGNVNANAAHTVSTAGVNLSLQRFYMPYNLIATRLDMLAHLTVAASRSGTWSISVGIYTRAGSTLNSASTTNSGVQFTSAGATNNSSAYVGISGTRLRSFSCASWSFTPGEYWLGVINTVVGVAGTTGSVTIFGQTSQNIQGIPGGNNDVIGRYGLFNAQTGAFPSTIHLTNIFYCHTDTQQSHVNRQPYIRMLGTY